MTKIFGLIIILISTYSCTKDLTISYNKLELEDGKYTYKDKLFEGKAIERNQRGTIIREFNCVEGLYNGNYREYNDLGKVIGIVNYKNGKKDGKSYYFFEDGTTSKEIDYSYGEKTGVYKEFYKNGREKVKGLFISDKKAGYWNYFYENGNEKKILKYLINGKKEGEFIEYFSNGKLKTRGKFVNDYLNGFWVFYYKENGNYYLKQGKFDMGKEYPKDKNGIPLSKREGEWDFYELNNIVEHKLDENGEVKTNVIYNQLNNSLSGYDYSKL